MRPARRTAAGVPTPPGRRGSGSRSGERLPDRPREDRGRLRAAHREASVEDERRARRGCRRRAPPVAGADGSRGLVVREGRSRALPRSCRRRGRVDEDVVVTDVRAVHPVGAEQAVGQRVLQPTTPSASAAVSSRCAAKVFDRRPCSARSRKRQPFRGRHGGQPAGRSPPRSPRRTWSRGTRARPLPRAEWSDRARTPHSATSHLRPRRRARSVLLASAPRRHSTTVTRCRTRSRPRSWSVSFRRSAVVGMTMPVGRLHHAVSRGRPRRPARMARSASLRRQSPAPLRYHTA